MDNKPLFENNFLRHYGILGMKWGIRRFQPYPRGEGYKGRYVGKRSTTSGRSQFNTNKPQTKSNIKTSQRNTQRSDDSKQAGRSGPSYDHVKSTYLKKQKLSSLTNKELKELNTRLDLEKEYSKLTGKQKNIGKKIAEDILQKGLTNYGSKVLEKKLFELTGIDDKPNYRKRS